jgi:serine/threonine protein kinase/WD40 repeat protein
MTEFDVFTNALGESDPDRRAALLDHACGVDRKLRRRVEVLLKAHELADNFLEDAPPLTAVTDAITQDIAAIRPPAALAPPKLIEGPGIQIGPYKLLQQIGEGGMGVVYMAEQETPVRRRVALKIIKPGMDSEQVIARFEAERQALAMMDHQNIARVLDAGTSDSGRPFFVMELVHGVPISKYCDDAQLTPRERLELFIPVCQAIQHAHQKGIIHRDIKPSNVLVTMYDGKPVAKVIDFGIAKAIDQRLTERTMFTQFGSLVGTLEYMSPEQAEMSALGVDTRSDIYSLGVLLYELLTGSTPLEAASLREAGYAEILKRIKEEEPPRPSTRLSESREALPSISCRRRTEPSKLANMLRGELDWIVLKALEKDRGRRYETANAFARDIERYLKDETVEACPPSAGYRLRKFARKYRAPLAVASGFALLLIAGALASTWQAIRATKAEREALLRRDAAARAEQTAQAERDIASVARRDSEVKREEAETARQLLRRSLYAADMQLAQAAWNSKSLLRMRELLERQQPGPGEADLRGFEWDYLRRESSTFRTFRPLANAVGGLMSPDARTFVHVVKVPAPGAVGQEFRLRRWDTASGRELRGFDPFPGETAIIHLSHDWFSPDGKRFAFLANVRDAAGRERWKLKVWEWESGRELFSLPEVPTSTVLAFDPSGARLAFAIPAPGDEPGCDLTIREIEGGKELVKNSLPTAKEFSPRSITFNPDGGRLAIVMGRIRTDSSSESPPVFEAMVLAAGSGQELLRFGAGQGSLMQFSPDGKRLAVSNQVRSSKLIVRDASSGEEVLHLTPEIDDLFLFKDIAFSPDGSRLASAGHDGKLRIWDVAGAGTTPERRPALILEGSDSPLGQLAWSMDGRSVSTSNYSGMILTWELAAGEGLLRQKGMLAGTPSCSVDLARFAASFRISSDETEVRVWNQAGQVLFTATDDTHEDEEPNIRHRRVELSPDGRRLAYLTLDYLVEAGKKKRVGRLRVWDLDGRKEIFRRDGDRGCFDRAAFSPDGKRLACVWFTGRDTAGKRPSRMSVWDLETRKEVHQMEVPMWAYGSRLAFSPDGLRLAAAMKGASEFKTSSFRIWDTSTGKVVLSREWSVAFIGGPVYNATGTFLAIAVGEWWGAGQVKVLDSSSGEELHSFTGHRYRVEEIAFSPDGRRLASIASLPYRVEAELKLWDIASERELLTLPARGNGSLAFTPDGRRLVHAATGLYSQDAELKFWDATPLPGRQLKTTE